VFRDEMHPIQVFLHHSNKLGNSQQESPSNSPQKPVYEKEKFHAIETLNFYDGQQALDA
jgi:hypothetical protein